MKINIIVTFVCIICLGTFSYAGGAQGKLAQGAKQKKAKSPKKIKTKAIRELSAVIHSTGHHSSTSSISSGNSKTINSSIYENVTYANLTPAPRLPTRKKGKTTTTKEDPVYAISKNKRPTLLRKAPSLDSLNKKKIDEIDRGEAAIQRARPVGTTTLRNISRVGDATSIEKESAIAKDLQQRLAKEIQQRFN